MAESGERAGYDGARRKRGSKLHMAVDTLGCLLAVQDATGECVELAFVDQGYTGERAMDAARMHGIELEVVKLPEAEKGFVLLPWRRVVERSFASATRFRHLVRDHEQYADALADMRRIAFVCLLLKQAVPPAKGS